MSDDRPAAQATDQVPMDLPAESPPAAPEPKGRCLKCGTVMPMDDTHERQGARVHYVTKQHRGMLASEVCGPVATRMEFHVYAKFQEGDRPERTIRTMAHAPSPPEADFAVLDVWETSIAYNFAKVWSEANGQPIEAAPKVNVTVERWQLIGWK
jgi:hypothetical protein